MVADLVVGETTINMSSWKYWSKVALHKPQNIVPSVDQNFPLKLQKPNAVVEIWHLSWPCFPIRLLDSSIYAFNPTTDWSNDGMISYNRFPKLRDGPEQTVQGVDTMKLENAGVYANISLEKGTNIYT